MKKALFTLGRTSFILTLLSLMIFPTSTLAQQAVEKTQEGFLNRVSDLTELSNYKTRNGFNGKGAWESANGDVQFEYRLNIVENNLKEGMFEGKSQAQINFFLNLLSNEHPDFERLTIMALGQTLGQDENLYLKLNEFNVNGEGYSQKMQDKVNGWLNHYQTSQGQWYLISRDFFGQMQIKEGGETPADEGLDTRTFLKNVFTPSNETDIKTRFVNELESLLNEVNPETVYALKKDKILEAVNLLMESESFAYNDILIGLRKGFTSFTLNKVGFKSLVEKMSHIMELPLTEGEKQALDVWVGRLFFSGAYKINDVHNKVDAFLLNVKLNKLGKISNLTAMYRFQLYDFGKAAVFGTVSDSLPVESLLEMFK